MRCVFFDQFEFEQHYEPVRVGAYEVMDNWYKFSIRRFVAMILNCPRCSSVLGHCVVGNQPARRPIGRVRVPPAPGRTLDVNKLMRGAPGAGDERLIQQEFVNHSRRAFHT